MQFPPPPAPGNPRPLTSTGEPFETSHYRNCPMCEHANSSHDHTGCTNGTGRGKRDCTCPLTFYDLGILGHNDPTRKFTRPEIAQALALVNIRAWWPTAPPRPRG